MANLAELDSFSVSRDGFPPHIKSPVIWGNKGARAFPLCYLQRPKSVDDATWRQFLDSLHIELRVKKEADE